MQRLWCSAGPVRGGYREVKDVLARPDPVITCNNIESTDHMHFILYIDSSQSRSYSDDEYKYKYNKSVIPNTGRSKMLWRGPDNIH